MAIFVSGETPREAKARAPSRSGWRAEEKSVPEHGVKTTVKTSTASINGGNGKNKGACILDSESDAAISEDRNTHGWSFVRGPGQVTYA